MAEVVNDTVHASASSVKGEQSPEKGWTAFHSAILPHPISTWSNEQPPAELLLLPESLRLNPKLVDIIQWSLQRPIPERGSAGADLAHNAISTESGPAAIQDNIEDIVETSSATSETKVKRAPHKIRGFKNDTVMHALSRIAALKEKHDFDRATSKALRKTHTAAEQQPTGECTSCFDDVPTKDLIKLPCSHHYCKVCLSTLVLTALRNESSFPPKCCLSEIPPALVIMPLDKKQQELYKEKAAEYSIPADRRVYCPDSTCLRWIPPSKSSRSRASSQKCPHCNTKVCGICRGLAHARNVDCPQDRNLEATINVAESEGWRRCYSCRTYVEVGPFSLVPFYMSPNTLKRTLGCRHITCRCGAEFCYVCGARWRTCECTEIDEANRQAILRRQRIEREAIDEAEADEVARAIAVVEALVRREEEARQEREAEEERERQREEQELARLEELRLQEEADRERERQEAEKQLRDTLRLSIKEDLDNLLSSFQELLQAQRTALDDRHSTEERKLEDSVKEATATVDQSAASLSTTMQKNIDRRVNEMKKKHENQLQELEQRQEEQEDDVFMQIQTHLKGKPNREAREKRMLDNMKKEQEMERTELVNQHSEQLKSLENVARMEVEGLKRSGDMRRRKVQKEHDANLKTTLQQVVCDREWFDVVCKRREEMVSKNCRVMLREFDAGIDLVGLTEEMASDVMPLPTAVEAHPGEPVSVLGTRRYDDSVQQTPVELEGSSSPKLNPPRQLEPMASSGMSYPTAASHVSSEEDLMSNPGQQGENQERVLRQKQASRQAHDNIGKVTVFDEPVHLIPQQLTRPQKSSAHMHSHPRQHTMPPMSPPSGPPPMLPLANANSSHQHGNYSGQMYELPRGNTMPPVTQKNIPRPSAPPTPPESPMITDGGPAPASEPSYGPSPRTSYPYPQADQYHTLRPPSDLQNRSPTQLSSTAISDDPIVVETPASSAASTTGRAPSTTSSAVLQRTTTTESGNEKKKKKIFKGGASLYASMINDDDYIANLEAKIGANEAEDREKERLRLEDGDVGRTKKRWFSRKG
jgi:hypothetical protein